MKFDTGYLAKKALGDVSIEVTDRCNLNCSYCFNESGSNNSREIPFSRIRCIVDDVAELEPSPTITLTGGEVFLRNDWEDIARYAIGRGLRVRFSTNGVLLKKNVVEKLEELDNGIDSIQVSLDGLNNTTNGLRTQTLTETIVENLNTLCESSLNPKVATRVTLSDSNKDSLEEIIDFCVNKQINVSWGHLQNIGRSQMEVSKVPGFKELCSTQVRLKELEAQRGLNYEIPALGVGVDVCHLLSSKHPFAIRIDSSGDVYPCQGTTNSIFVIGNIYSDGIRTILQGQAMKELVILLMIRQKIMVRSNCKNCFIRNGCKGGCPGMADETGDFFSAPERFCKAWKLFVAQDLVREPTLWSRSS